MQSTRRPRLVIFIVVLFLALGTILGAAAPVLNYHIEWAGVTMLGALAIAMAMMAYVLIVGSSDD